MRTLMFATMLAATAVADEIAEKYPVAENVRGHENTEWSISYAYHLTDAKKNLPRVLLVGDSICQGYQGKVAAKLDGKANVTYWASSYCVTSPGYLRLLAFYLDEAKYDVIHFNNGLHSCETPVADYEKAYRNALRLVKDRQPGAKIVWASSTPINATDSRAGKVAALNAAARRAAQAIDGISTDDLFALMDPLDRVAYWTDAYHYKDAGYELIASQVVERVTEKMTLTGAQVTRGEGLYRCQVHRGGGRDTRPDNSLETFLWCWGHGVAPEADARLTKDGVAERDKGRRCRLISGRRVCLDAHRDDGFDLRRNVGASRPDTLSGRKRRTARDDGGDGEEAWRGKADLLYVTEFPPHVALAEGCAGRPRHGVAWNLGEGQFAGIRC